MNKRADGGLTAIVIIVVILVFLSYLVNLSSRQCSSNKDCDDDAYCGSGFACHKIPVIERQTSPVIVNRDFSGAAWIIGIAIVIAALFFNWDKIFHGRNGKREKKEKRVREEKVYHNMPVYYETQSK